MSITKLLIVVAFLITLFLTGYAEADQLLPQYDLAVSFDTGNNLLRGSAKITFPAQTKTDISQGDLKILSARVNGKPVEFQGKNGAVAFEGKGTLEIEFEAVFKGESGQNFVNAIPYNIVSSAGILLADRWYPEISSLAHYRVSATVPSGFLAISSAEEVIVSNKGQETEYSFIFPYPVQQISLIAGHYREKKENWKGVNIHAYFFSENTYLAQSYIEYTKKYLDEYEKLLSPYPYKRISVVEGFQPADYAAPTVAVIGREQITFSFLTDSSFSRVILRQWFGGSIYVEAGKGNWADGLTAYLADQRAEEQRGKGKNYRKQILINYASYVDPVREHALKDYQGAVDLASGVTGYGKGSMFFSMLEKLAGKDVFSQVLQTITQERQFQVLSWDNFRTVFEQISGDDLSWFFQQWITRKGVPSVEVSDLKVIMKKGVPTVTFDLRQQGEPYRLTLPVRISTESEGKSEVLTLKQALEHFEIPVNGTPVEISFDDEYEVMRKIAPEEFPPVIATFLGSEKRIFVMSRDERQRSRKTADALAKAGFVIKEDQDIKDEDIRTSSLLVLGHDSPVLHRLFGGVQKPKSGLILSVQKNPLNPDKVIAVASGGPVDDSDRFIQDMYRYGEYSFVHFEQGSAREKKTDDSENGIAFSFDESVLVFQPQKAEMLKDILPSLLHVPIIYLGERHTSYEDHKVQLEVIQYLHEKGRKFAIGMEMFQQPFQKSIDEYLDGTLNEREFLRATGYYKRWQYEYNNYREIVEYAKARHVPLKALNIRSEIVQKVAATGMDSLSDSEWKEIPGSMDMSDWEYRARLEQIFENHRHQGNRSFENFYQSQILWDETMAHAIAQFMEENPGHQMVILAGAGHVIYGSGIPKRAFRLNGKQYTVVVPDEAGIDRDAGNFVLFAEQQEPPLTLKLGIMANKTETGLKIDQIVPRSIAAAAGIEEGDILVALDDWKIAEIEDVRIFMSDKQRGDTIKLTVLRKKFLFGYKPLELTVTI
ncbi:MAG: ChaN family lipoprotein [Thermodesulfovibrionales bacterium]|nr:ChaN family lipoprotein [Thermodesulfovibrionales bacterium]